MRQNICVGEANGCVLPAEASLDESGAKLTECTRSVSRTQEEKKHQEQKVTVSKNNEEESGEEEIGGEKSQALTLREQMRILRKEQCRSIFSFLHAHRTSKYVSSGC